MSWCRRSSRILVSISRRAGASHGSPAVLPLAAAALLLAPLAGPLAATEPETSASRPTLGTHAPGFKLRDQHGRWVDLEEHRGRRAVRDAGAVILGISVDDVASHKQFAEEHGLPFPILADSAKEVAKKYGVLRSLGVMEVALIIDPKGRIVNR